MGRSLLTKIDDIHQDVLFGNSPRFNLQRKQLSTVTHCLTHLVLRELVN